MTSVSEIKLIGYPVSNYFNIVRAALIEKNIAHQIEMTSASQDDDFLAKNPMGKIPVLQVGGNHISETVAILEYLEDMSDAIKLRPANALERARMRQAINIIQVYLEVPARHLYPVVFMNGTLDKPLAQNVRAQIDRGTAALSRLLAPAPWLLGSTFSSTDIFAYYNLGMIERVCADIFGFSLIDGLGWQDWWCAMGKRESTIIVMSDFEQYLPAYLKDKNSGYQFQPQFKKLEILDA